MATTITTDNLRALAATRSAEGKVLSLFVNLDPQEFPTPAARATEIASMLDSASRRVRERTDLTATERSALDGDLARVRAHLADEGRAEMVNGSRGLAVFASEPAGLFDVLALPYVVAPGVRIADRPALRPIARLASTDPWSILLADRRHARLLSGGTGGLVERWRIEDPVAGRHGQGPSHARDQGGLSHERYRRSADKDAADHLRGVIAEVRAQLDGAPSAGLLLGGPPETVKALRELMGTEMARTVRGTVDVDVWASSPHHVLQAALPVIGRLEAGDEQALLERIADAVGTGRGAGGLNEVLEGLNGRRVATIAVEPGASAHGVRCPACGWLGISAGGSCPGCGTATEIVEDIVEEAVAAALSHGAKVVVLTPPSELPADSQGVAALLRF